MDFDPGRMIGAGEMLVVMSDHGFTSWRRAVNLNTWLHQQGLLVLADGCAPGPDAGDMLRHVDWDRTKAYALGLAGIYINQQDREARGIVPADEAELGLVDRVFTRVGASDDLAPPRAVAPVEGGIDDDRARYVESAVFAVLPIVALETMGSENRRVPEELS